MPGDDPEACQLPRQVMRRGDSGDIMPSEDSSRTNGSPTSGQLFQDTSEESPKHIHGSGPKLTMLPLVALIFYEVSGGPFGVEGVVRHGGPLLALLGFLIFPMIWSVPEALITAELATAFPENGGYVVWIAAAFGDFWGFQDGWWSWCSGVIDNSLYPVLFLDYAKSTLPWLAAGVGRFVALTTVTLLLTYMNYRGLTIVGHTAVALAVFSLLPFIVMIIVAIPRLRPARWLRMDLSKVNWQGYLNILFWNLNYWDSASTLAGEVEKPRRTFPRALLVAVFVVVASYLFPLMVGTGALDVPDSVWTDGYFAEVAGQLGGKWLMVWVVVAAALSNIGLFEAEMSSDSFQLLGMSERGMLPEVFARRSRYGTPTLAVCLSASGVVLLSWLSFEEIVELLNFLYCIGMLLEFAAFVYLRVKDPDLERPWRVPLGVPGLCAMLFLPTVLLLVVMALASVRTVVVSLCALVVGFLLQPLLVHMKTNNWCTFLLEPALPSLSSHERHYLPVHRNDVNAGDHPIVDIGGSTICEDSREVKEDNGTGLASAGCDTGGAHSQVRMAPGAR